MGKSVSKDIDISWSDLDAFGHVNNAAYLRYMEDTRVDWLVSLNADWESSGHGPAVVNININFRRELLFPASIRVNVNATLASDKRLLHRYVITDRTDPGIIYSDAELTLVWIDRETRRSIPVPMTIRNSLTAENLESSHVKAD